MDKYRVDVSEPAEKDLQDIIRYISAQLSAPATALEMMEALENAMMSLTDMPQKSPPVTDEHLATMGYRKLLVKNYIVFFSIDEKGKVVSVERILYTRRNWSLIL
jgi:plasmid stabilization system protein ParE